MRTRKIYYFVGLVILASGCTKLDPTPEAKDRIYQDFLAEAEKAKKDIEAKEKELEANKQKLETVADDSYEKKLTRADVFKNENELKKLKQKQLYYQLSAESRLIYDKKQNLEAFKRQKTWDPSDSADLYFKEKAYLTQGKQWTRGMASVPAKKEEKKSESHGE